MIFDVAMGRCVSTCICVLFLSTCICVLFFAFVVYVLCLSAHEGIKGVWSAVLAYNKNEKLKIKVGV